MELEQFAGGLTTELIDSIKRERADRPVATYLKQYRPQDHDVMQKDKRIDKIINTGTEESPKMESVPVNRVAIPYQKRIVAMAATFLCGNPIALECAAEKGVEENLLSVIKKTWEDNKLDYASKRIAKLMMSETEVAELWYTEEVDADYWNDTPNAGKKIRFRMKVLAYSLGDTLYPVFNMFGDMVAFGREYTVKNAGQDEQHFDLYTSDKIQRGVKTSTGWEITTEKNIIGKIPVIYYSQEHPEWHDVQSIIDRQEKLRSNHADTNDYNGSPTVLVKGRIEKFSKKGEQGKVLELEDSGSAEYMSWDHAPESVRMELENNDRDIYEHTSTPNVSFEKMQKLGAASGFLVKMLFTDPHMKASDKEEVFGEGVQRRINYLKHGHITTNSSLKAAATMSIKPRFEYFLPKNDVEKIDMLVTATSGGVLSKKTAVSLNPLVTDPDSEMDEIKEDGLNNEMNNL